jgi:hypothetical protein
MERERGSRIRTTVVQRIGEGAIQVTRPSADDIKERRERVPIRRVREFTP